ncbi:MAG: four helix bundle protein [Ignavibacterium album]|jgi:four helix bundle protein|uniref:four helix bundle protein n=1 Tax=Ignavibacterium album TaxID=591197 RepID=UPI0026F01925|nr:four helix bundle protein [Ignavibacterium album]MCX8104469.1 four helix bundle protein [Ignavibacterium album]
MTTKQKFDLEDRLIAFAVLIIKITETLNNTKAGNHIAGQLVRSGTSPALQYGEAQSAESINDFIHKLKILLKELRESLVSLKIIKEVLLTEKIDLVDRALLECNELIAIFVKSIETAKKNNDRRK